MRNWGYFEEVGMVRHEVGGVLAVENSLIYAACHVVANLPLDVLEAVPALSPERLIPLAQRYIDSAKDQQSAPEE